MAEEVVAEVAEEVVPEEEVEAVEGQQPVPLPPEEEETRNSSGRNRPPSTGTDKMSTDSYRISRDICR